MRSLSRGASLQAPSYEEAGKHDLIISSSHYLLFFKKGGIGMEAPGPISICITNMVIVFGVLIFLACVIQLIHIVDPTKNKK